MTRLDIVIDGDLCISIRVGPNFMVAPTLSIEVPAGVLQYFTNIPAIPSHCLGAEASLGKLPFLNYKRHFRETGPGPSVQL